MKDITISFPGGKRVDAHYDGRTVHTDQSVKNGGEVSEGDCPGCRSLFREEAYPHTTCIQDRTSGVIV